jgi:hypothetical protein
MHILKHNFYFSSHQEINVPYTMLKCRFTLDMYVTAPGQPTPQHDWNRNNWFLDRLSLGNFPPTIYNYRVYYTIFHIGKEVLASLMWSTHWSGGVWIHVSAGTTSLIFTNFCEDIMLLKGCIMQQIINFCDQLYRRGGCVNSWGGSVISDIF